MIRHLPRLRCLSLVVPLAPLVAACSGGRSQQTADASVDASANAPLSTSVVAPARGPIEHARAISALARHFDPDLHLVRVGSGYQLDGYVPSVQRVGGRFTPAFAERLLATLPARSSGALHVGVRGDDRRERDWIEVVAQDLESAPARVPEVRAGAVAYRDAVPGHDLVQLLEPGRVEELRVVRVPTDRVVTRHRVRASASIKTLRVRDGIVEVLDRAERVVIASEPIVAYDAAGGLVSARVSVEHDAEGWLLETSVDARGRAFPITIDPTWTPTLPDVPNAHDPPFMFPLAGSKVLLVGGGRADVFDPYAGTAPWSTIAGTVTCGNAMPPVQLQDGKLLFAGAYYYSCIGSGPGIYTVSMLFDPVAGTTTRVGDLPNNHSWPGLTLLSDGRVVAFGSSNGSSSPDGAIDVYNPGSKTWTTALVTPLPSGLGGFTMTALDPVGGASAPGKVLIAGGGTYSANSGSAAYLFDPVANTFTATGSLHANRSFASATKLADGTVLVFGGQAGSGSTAEIYDPVAGSFSVVASTMSYSRMRPGLTQMPDGRWFIVGGVGFPAGGSGNGALSTTEFFDPVSKTFSPGTSSSFPHYDPALAPLPGGRVLVAGGSGVGGLNEPAEIYTPDPVTSTTGAGCPSGFAADGYCCDRACTGTCEACNLPGHVGVCTPVVGAPPAGHGSCAPFLCAGMSLTTGQGVCATSCGSDAGCAAGDYCDLASSQCVAQKARASGCARNAECTGGDCVDGVCCDTACNAKACQACDVAGSVGTCTDVASGDPHGTHGTCGVYACVAGACASGTCTADTQCASHRFCTGGSCGTAAGQGATCGRDAQCQSGHCVDGFCCDGACGAACQACDVPSKQGTCTNVATGAPHGTRSCGSYAACTAGVCASTCAVDTDCTTGNGCSATKCVVRKANGASCATGTDCASGSCADGVCCNTACNGGCQACNLTATIGTCTAVDGFADPHGKCATGPCGDVCKAGACGFKPAGFAACGAGACASGVLTAASCDGTSATCPPTTAAPCAGSLVCASATACKSACVVDADCTSGVCDATGKCVAPIPDAGPVDTGVDTAVADTAPAPDTAVADTAPAPDTALAPDTAIADTDVADTAAAPDTATAEDTRGVAEVGAPKLPVTPIISGFQRCHEDGECGSSHCVEGVCCDTACKEACHSCALLSSPGICSLEPIGVDLKNDCGPGLSCLGTCGAAGECIGSGTGTQCARNRCTGPSTGLGPAYCPGPGAQCDTNGQVPFDCGAYACEPAFGACLVKCSTTDECAPGNVCDPATTLCGPMPTPPSTSGGCTLGAPGTEGASTSAGLSAAGAALAALAFARRRRARGGASIARP
jgi:hypothetical protein